MQNNKPVTASEITEDFGISESIAYMLIKEMNDELKQRGYITVAGRVSKKYYLERTYSEDTSYILQPSKCFSEGE